MADSYPAEWGIMTDRERAAWVAKNRDPARQPREHSVPEPTPGSVEAQIEEQRQRKFGYIKKTK